VPDCATTLPRQSHAEPPHRGRESTNSLQLNDIRWPRRVAAVVLNPFRSSVV